jgi:beta-N-acetylhexosaminidase
LFKGPEFRYSYTVFYRGLSWVLCGLFLAGCAWNGGKAVPETADDPAVLFGEYRVRAARIAGLMDNRALAAQTLLSGVDGKGALSPAMETLLESVPVGGIVLFKYNLDTGKDEIRGFLRECSELIGGGVPGGIPIPPFVAVDHEGGSVHRFGPGVERLPPAASFWDMAQKEGRGYALKSIEAGAYRSGAELRDLGITMNLAPVAEALNGENRLFLGDRSYGPDADFVAAAAGAFVRGMERAGVFCAPKHFPGNSGADPHRERALLEGGRETLDAGVRPFAALIRETNPSALMVSHAVVPAWDAERSASLSPSVIGQWLRGDLAFTGIILADDFSMGAVAGSGKSPGEAAVEAINAGVDMVMTWPMNLAQIHGALVSAAEDGRIPRERLLDAAEQVLFEKIRRGLIP